MSVRETGGRSASENRYIDLGEFEEKKESTGAEERVDDLTIKSDLPSDSMTATTETPLLTSHSLDSLSMPSAPPPQGVRKWCSRKVVTWVKAGTSLTLLGLSLFIRCTYLSPVSQVVSSVGIGLGGQCLINACVPNKYTSRVQQVALSVFGSQAALYTASQIWANTANVALQVACTSSIGGMLGVALAMYGKDFIQKNFLLRSESASKAQSDLSSARFKGVFLSERIDYVKGVAAVGFAAAWVFAHLASDPVSVGIASFLATYYSAEIAGQRSCSWLDRKIVEKTQMGAQQGLTQIQRSRHRLLKTAMNTLGFFAIPLSWIPWTADPRTAARSAQMPFVGLLTGFFSGFSFRSQESRFKNISLDRLEELKSRASVQNRLFRIWEVSWPILTFTALTGFVIKQWVDPSLSLSDKLALASMYIGVAGILGRNFVVEKKWNLRERISKDRLTLKDRIKDRVIISQHLPRLFGINPLYGYFLLTNSIAMHSGQELTSTHKVLNGVAWGSYGMAMANAFWETWVNRRGSIFASPMMVMINAILTLKGVMEGKGTHE